MAYQSLLVTCVLATSVLTTLALPTSYGRKAAGKPSSSPFYAPTKAYSPLYGAHSKLPFMAGYKAGLAAVTGYKAGLAAGTGMGLYGAGFGLTGYLPSTLGYGKAALGAVNSHHLAKMSYKAGAAAAALAVPQYGSYATLSQYGAYPTLGKQYSAMASLGYGGRHAGSKYAGGAYLQKPGVGLAGYAGVVPAAYPGTLVAGGYRAGPVVGGAVYGAKRVKGVQYGSFGMLSKKAALTGYGRRG